MSKVSFNQLSSLTQQELDPQDVNRRVVYARCANKNTIKLILQLPVKVEQLKNTIFQRFRFKHKNFLLFCQGIQITLQEELTNIKNGAIVHIVSLEQTNQNQIKVFFKEIDSQETIEAKVNTNEQIVTYFQNQIKNRIGKGIQQVFLIYLGKAINPNQTFAQAFVQNECEILITKVKRKIPQLQNSFKTINQSYQKVNEDYIASMKLGMPYKESRTLTDHQSFKKKQIQKMDKQKNKNTSMGGSLKKIEERSPDNEEVPSQMIPQVAFKTNLGLKDDISYEISKLKIEEEHQNHEEKPASQVKKAFCKNKQE